MRKDLTSEQLLLAEYMSDISERCYSANWIQGLEYALWDAVLHGQRKYGHDTISQKDIEMLSDLAKAANTWITFDDAIEEKAMDLHNWKEKFQQDVRQNPQFLEG